MDAAGVISTVAGAGSFGFGGDGGPAAAGQLRSPSGVAVDGAGNLYIADTDNHRIRKVDATGTITTIAGTGEPVVGLIVWDVGDGGPATAAPLSSPGGVAVDGGGNVYIADTGRSRIRKVDAAGVISTVAGSFLGGFGGDGGPAVEAALYYPEGVAVDGAGNLFIADSLNDRIRKVDAAGVISTVAGTGSFGFSGDGGPGVEAQLNDPADVTTDGAGNLYIADRYNDRIRKVDSAGVISTVAGTGESLGGFSGDGGPATAALLSSPRGRGGGRGGQPLHRRSIQRPDTEGGLRGGHQHRGGHGRVFRRVQRGRRPSDRGPAKFPRGRGGGRGGQPLHRRYGQPPRSQADAGRQLNASESNRPGPHDRTARYFPPGTG